MAIRWRNILWVWAICTVFILGTHTLCSKIWWESLGQDYKFDLTGKNILIIVGDDFDFGEYFEISKCWKKWGAQVEVAGTSRDLSGHVWQPSGGVWDNSERRSINVDYLLGEIELNRYDALFFPGGNSPANLLKHDSLRVVTLIRQAHDKQLTLAAICHGAHLLASADILTNRRATGHPDVYEILRQSGARLRKQVYVVDDNIVTVNWPYFETAAVKVAQRILFPDELRVTRTLNAYHTAVYEKAWSLTAGLTTDADRALKIFEFVRDSANERHCQSMIASEILRCGGNRGFQRSILAVALCRAVGVPARLHFQKVTLKNYVMPDGRRQDLDFNHGIVGVNLNGGWRLYEMTGNRRQWMHWNQDQSRGDEMPLRFSARHDCLFRPNDRVNLVLLPEYYNDVDPGLPIFAEALRGQ